VIRSPTGSGGLRFSGKFFLHPCFPLAPPYVSKYQYYPSGNKIRHP